MSFEYLLWGAWRFVAVACTLQTVVEQKAIKNDLAELVLDELEGPIE